MPVKTPRPLTRAQRMENAAFLKELRRTGNAATAARALGFGRSRFLNRRRAHPAFAAEWEAALAVAHAALHVATSKGSTDYRPVGDPTIRRSNNGRLQLRRYRPGILNHAGRQRFLAALCATANVRLSAAAAGFNFGTLYHERHRNPAFAREWQLALEMGWERLEMALLESAQSESFADDDWRRNDPPAIPPMTANQALQLLYLHQKTVVLGVSELPDRLRKGETQAARLELLAMRYEVGQERERMKFRIAEAERLARGEPTHFNWDPGELPDLSQVTGWSRASGKPVTDPTRALFGGWRIADIPPDKSRG